MAHVAKYKSGALGRMLNHYQREAGDGINRSNENIDPERTHLNYCIGHGGGVDFIQDRIDEVRESSGRAVKKDAVVMADWVITAPADLRQEDLFDFFHECHDFVCERYGRDNVLGAYVHMDETTPHAHIAFTPVLEREDGRLSFCAKQMIDRNDLRTFHSDLSDAVEDRLGYRTQIELAPEMKLEKALSKIDGMDEYRIAAERLERLRQDERRLEAENRTLQRDLGEARERCQEAIKARSEAFEKVDALEAERGAAFDRIGVLDRLRDELVERIEGLRERVRGLRGYALRLELEVGSLRTRYEDAKERLSDLASRIREGRSLGDMRQWDLGHDRSDSWHDDRSQGFDYER